MIFSCRPGLNVIWLEHTLCRYEVSLNFDFPHEPSFEILLSNLWKQN